MALPGGGKGSAPPACNVEYPENQDFGFIENLFFARTLNNILH